MLAAGLVVVWLLSQARVSLAARGALKAAAAFLGVAEDVVRVVRGPQTFEAGDGEKLVQLTVEYREPGRMQELRAQLGFDPKTGLVRFAIWPDLFGGVPEPSRPLPETQLKARAASFVRGHNPLPGSRVQFTRAYPFPANQTIRYTFEWALVRPRDGVPLGRVSTTIRSIDGRIASYYYHPVNAEVLRRVRISRESAVAIARRKLGPLGPNEVAELKGATLVDRSPWTPRGRALWAVQFSITQATPYGPFRRGSVVWIDAATGKVVRKDP